MAAYRFLRLLFGGLNSGGNATVVETITLAGVDGVNRAINGAAASGDPDTEIAASNAVAGSGSEWASTRTAGAYWIYDLGAGNTVDIQTIGLTAASFTAGFPTSFQVQSSETNNGSDWINAWANQAIPPNPGGGQVFTFAYAAPPPPPPPFVPTYTGTVFDALTSSALNSDFVISSDTQTVTRSNASVYATGLGFPNAGSGKLYFEVTCVSPGNQGAFSVGVSQRHTRLGDVPGVAANSLGFSAYGNAVRFDTGDPSYKGMNLGGLSAGAVFGVAVDFTRGNVWFVGPSGLWNGQPLSTDNPAHGLGGCNGPVYYNGTLAKMFPSWLFPNVSVYSGSSGLLNVGQKAFSYRIPAGFTPWATDPVLPAKKHRFCRILCHQTGDGTNDMGCSRITLAEADGANRALDVSSAYASSGGSPGVCIAGQQGDWGTDAADPTPWWAYDFGAGNGLNITRICITSRTESYYGQMPTAFEVQHSDDGASWVTDWTVTGGAAVTTPGVTICWGDPVGNAALRPMMLVVS